MIVVAERCLLLLLGEHVVVQLLDIVSIVAIRIIIADYMVIIIVEVCDVIEMMDIGTICCTVAANRCDGRRQIRELLLLLVMMLILLLGIAKLLKLLLLMSRRLQLL